MMNYYVKRNRQTLSLYLILFTYLLFTSFQAQSAETLTEIIRELHVTTLFPEADRWEEAENGHPIYLA